MTAPAAFINAVKAMRFPPPDAEKFWSTWCRCAEPRQLPRAIVDLLRDAFPGFQVNRSWGGIVGVASDGYVRQFIPDYIIFCGKAHPDPTAPLIAWLRGGQGYVDDPLALDEITKETEAAP